MPQLHCMLDLETLGTGPYAPIISIGAVKFDPTQINDKFDDRFHVGIKISTLPAGLIENGTLEWWLDPARAEALKVWQSLEKVDFQCALDGFAQWYGDDPLVPVWGNGASFDNVILGNAYKMANIAQPWGFRADRCYRTIKSLVPWRKPDFTGLTAHSALDDAIAQARHLQVLWASLSLGLGLGGRADG